MRPSHNWSRITAPYITQCPVHTIYPVCSNVPHVFVRSSWYILNVCVTKLTLCCYVWWKSIWRLYRINGAAASIIASHFWRNYHQLGIVRRSMREIVSRSRDLCGCITCHTHRHQPCPNLASAIFCLLNTQIEADIVCIYFICIRNIFTSVSLRLFYIIRPIEPTSHCAVKRGPGTCNSKQWMELGVEWIPQHKRTES